MAGKQLRSALLEGDDVRSAQAPDMTDGAGAALTQLENVVLCCDVTWLYLRGRP